MQIRGTLGFVRLGCSDWSKWMTVVGIEARFCYFLCISLVLLVEDKHDTAKEDDKGICSSTVRR